jgi:3-oxoacyl-[acyl-carrier protein] reductase
MDLGLQGRLAVITGASSGLGRACALALAAEGARIAVVARRADVLATVVDDARAAGSPDARAYAVDLADAVAVDAFLTDVRREQGDPDILVANSGPPPPGNASAITLAQWDAAYAPTMRVILQLVSGVVPAMRARAWGRIIYIGSSALKTPIPNLALSNAFRAGVLGALKSLSFDVARDGVTINVVAPGRIETERAANLYADPEVRRRSTESIPAGRFGTPEEFAPLVAFLAGEPARYITGTTIAVDGGLSPTLT